MALVWVGLVGLGWFGLGRLGVGLGWSGEALGLRWLRFGPYCLGRTALLRIILAG